MDKVAKVLNKPKLLNLSKWLSVKCTENYKKKYSHRLLEEFSKEREDVIDELSIYFDAAHEPAKIASPA